MNGENLAKLYFIETKRVISFRVAGWQENAGGENEDDLRDVVENKWIKTVRFPPFQDVDENK